MTRIHVLTQKEFIDPTKLRNCIVVVFDVMLATTTITTLLQYGAKKVIPVLNAEEALQLSENLNIDKNSVILSGEVKGQSLENFKYPCPLELIESNVEGKTVILSTTNGTVALKKSLNASLVYASSLLNGKYVAQNLLQAHKEQSILLVCSGNHGGFSMEDFIGAGHFIHHLQKLSGNEFELSDSAIVALKFYENCHDEALQDYFLSSHTGKLLTTLGYKRSIYHSVQRDLYRVVPVLRNGDYPYLELDQVGITIHEGHQKLSNS
ncbi:2-phosphosulfolactate phosphatase [Bacillus sp. B15-48]|uniref:2-phosphosulfolactate phosphatase n=1 Tax=Bacillus sp. B15-48 TaxID=1548601 RepID=UPI001940199A|nr:2-phosphosulfolactate phosphatase [Bacillus sp. B15-48]MBM4761847.1 2-phosphosulfolactate phosphatase [Bacillus sp. B15-48]